MDLNDFRLYNRRCSNFFDIIGHKEPDQTKSLGFLLSKSQLSMDILLGLIFRGNKKVLNELAQCQCVVDCEMIGNQKDRADVVLRFYDSNIPIRVVIIEAKSTKSKVESNDAATQAEKYSKIKVIASFGDNVTYATITRQISFDTQSQTVIAITWQQLITSFYQAAQRKNNSDFLLRDYVNYLIKIKGTMQFYDQEVLSLPAGKALEAVVDPDCALYECPTEGKQFKTRGAKHFLFFAFRKARNNGMVTKLYKVDDILTLDIGNDEQINAVANERDYDGNLRYPAFDKRIQKYKSVYSKGAKGSKFVFLLNMRDSIDLPFPVRYKKTRGMNGACYHQIKDFIGRPEQGDDCIWINN